MGEGLTAAAEKRSKQLFGMMISRCGKPQKNEDAPTF
jgi:hypothetical protein